MSNQPKHPRFKSEYKNLSEITVDLFKYVELGKSIFSKIISSNILSYRQLMILQKNHMKGDSKWRRMAEWCEQWEQEARSRSKAPKGAE
jgi:hypothetical protein